LNTVTNIKIERFEEISSTQEYCKERIGKGENLFVTAKRQTAGHGTKGRSFSSGDGGLYFTMLLHPENFPAENAFLVMARTATAVCKTLESFGLAPKIKWPNDIHLQGKKVCGILIENRLQGKYLSSSLIGVGLNINNRLEADLAPIACSMLDCLGSETEILAVENAFRGFFFAPFCFDDYLARLGYLGKEVSLAVGETTFSATLVGVSEKGLLQVKIGGELREYSAGEITLRI
jgi:BirA family biotin operon repressor/biotin-[acetyl-CoA-carboxylase] ligase